MTKKTPKIKTIANLEANDCRWPFGDPRQPGFHFCGAPQQAGRPYCAAHCAMSFDVTKVRQPSTTPAFVIRRAA
jgi:hypothetical protein